MYWKKKRYSTKRKQEWYCWWKTSCMGCITPVDDGLIGWKLPTVSTGAGLQPSTIPSTIIEWNRTCCIFGVRFNIKRKKTNLYRAWGTEWLREFSWILWSSVFPPKMIFLPEKKIHSVESVCHGGKVSAQKKSQRKKYVLLIMQHLCWNPAPIARYGSALNCLYFYYFISFHILQILKMPREAQDGRKVCGVTFLAIWHGYFALKKCNQPIGFILCNCGAPNNRIHGSVAKTKSCFPLKDCNTWMTKFVEKVDLYRKFFFYETF